MPIGESNTAFHWTTDSQFSRSDIYYPVLIRNNTVQLDGDAERISIASTGSPHQLYLQRRLVADWTVAAVALAGLLLNVAHLSLLQLARLPLFANLRAQVRMKRSLRFMSANEDPAATAASGANGLVGCRLAARAELVAASNSGSRITSQTFKLFGHVMRFLNYPNQQFCYFIKCLIKILTMYEYILLRVRNIGSIGVGRGA